MISVKPDIASLPVYSPPWRNLDRRKYLCLDLNENTQPPPKYVNIALKKLIDEKYLQLYPSYNDFLPILSKYTGVSQNNLIITNGSDQAIDIILRAYLSANDGMVIAEPGFPIFNQFARILGVNMQSVLYNDDLSFPHEKILAKINSLTRIIVVINPNNPTGSQASLEQIREILEKNPDIPVIVDEAYFEFTELTCVHLLEKFTNLVIIRTFSKAFAMAGLRLGYIIAHENVIYELHKIRGPFDVNTCALVAASAQIENSLDWKKYVRDVITVSKPLIEQFFKEKRVYFYPGAANFMLVKPKNKDIAINYLKDNKILVRPMEHPTIQGTFRMSIGTPAESDRFIKVYNKFLLTHED